MIPVGQLLPLPKLSPFTLPPSLPPSLSLSLSLSSQGKPEIAVPFCKKAVLELKQRKGSEDPDVAAMLNILAVIYRYVL